ncbi:MAG: hypothetical protein ACFB4I_21465 [Cyanophyceae cyanobacterium]
MSRVFIHVGLHKTASTFFQTEVFPYFDNTICITRPYTQQGRGFNQLQFADDTVYEPKELESELEPIKEQNKNLIISDECLSGLPDINYLNRSLIADRLSKIFPQGEIILFIRGQKDILLSLYNQYVKMGGINPIDLYLWYPKEEYTYAMYCSKDKKDYWRKSTRPYNLLTKNINREHFLYYRTIKMYHEKFCKVHVFLYEDFYHNPQQVIERLENIMQKAFKKSNHDTLIQRKNEKLIDSKIEITRYQNIVKPVLNTKNKYVIRLAALLYAQLFEIKKRQQKSFSHSKYVDDLIVNFYIKDNQKIIEEYPNIALHKYPQKYQV